MYVCFKAGGKVEEKAEEEELISGWNPVCILRNLNSIIIIKSNS